MRCTSPEIQLHTIKTLLGFIYKFILIENNGQSCALDNMLHLVSFIGI
jgi:hypothetical protein